MLTILPRLSSLTLILLCGVVAGCSSSSSAPNADPSEQEASDAPGNGVTNGAAGNPGAMGAGGSAESGPPGDVALLPATPPGDGMPATGAVPEPPLEGDIRFSVPSGTFEGSLSVTLETELEGAEIRYTTDGSVPGPNSPLYDGSAISFDETRQIRARAFAGGVAVGLPGTSLYIARTFDATSDLPLIIVEGYGTGKPEDPNVYVDMAFMVFEPDAAAAALSDAPVLATRAGYHIRGQSSADFEQAPYRVELWNNASEDADHPLLGMPADADWALIGPYVDRSLIRNAFAYGLGRDLGLATPRYAFAEVYINYEDRPLEPGDYQGIYMVVETIKNHPDRLDLAQLGPTDTSPEDLSGGYIFKFDWAAAEEPTLECSGSAPLAGGGVGGGNPPGGGGGTCWADLEVVDPEPLSDAQAAWLTDYVQVFHDALHEGPFEQYGELINVGSFVDVFIVNELTRNLDAYTRSAFYFKERDQPLSAGPLWDFNLTLGAGFGTNLEVEGWQFEERRVASDWYRILGVDPAFLALVSARWTELRQTLLSQGALDARIDALTEPLQAAAVRDFERWPVAVVDADSFFQIPTDPTWDGQVQVIRDWLTERIAWLDSQL